jgi:phage-related protein
MDMLNSYFNFFNSVNPFNYGPQSYGGQGFNGCGNGFGNGFGYGYGYGYGNRSQDSCSCSDGNNWKEYIQDRKDERASEQKLTSNKIDLNGDGKYSTGIDGRLVLDWDKDGKISKDDIKKSKQALNRFDDLWDVSDEDNDDAPDLKQFDKDNDGTLSTKELQDAGASIWVDRNGDGERGRGEFFEADSVDSRYRKNLALELDLKTGEMTAEKSDDD